MKILLIRQSVLIVHTGYIIYSIFIHPCISVAGGERQRERMEEGERERKRERERRSGEEEGREKEGEEEEREQKF